MAVELGCQKPASPPRGLRPGEVRARGGQSIVEFMLILPVAVGFFVVMVRVNTAIQVGIVNQQYARMQALFLAYNSDRFPRLGQISQNFVRQGFNHMVIGVSDNAPRDGGDVRPEATTQSITRKPRPPASADRPGEEPRERAAVRVRSTVTLCTQVHAVGGQALLELEPQGSAGDFRPRGTWTLAENTTFDFCGGPGIYEQ